MREVLRLFQLTLVSLLSGKLRLRRRLDELRLQYRLRPVQTDLSVASLLLRGLLQKDAQPYQAVFRQIVAPPLEDEGLLLSHGLQGTLGHILFFRNGQLFLPVVATLAVGAGGHGKDHRLVIPEQGFVVQIEVVIADGTALAQRIVKGGVQMVVSAVQPNDIPGVAVLDALFRVVLRDGNDAPQPRGVAQRLDCLGNALADGDALTEGSQNLVGIGFFQLVVPDILTDIVVDLLLLVPVAFAFDGAKQFLDP